MKISGIRLPNLQNAEHFQFHTDALALMTDATPAALKITAQYDLYLAAFRTEDAIMRQILRSARTAEIAEADRARDEIFRGMANLNKAMLTHFDDARRAAAGRIQIVFDTYGNVAAEALAKESADIHNLLQELAGAQHAADCEALGLVPWIAELDRRNVAVQELMLDRYEEQPVTDGLTLRAARLRVDEAYHTVADRLDARTILDPDETLAVFVGELNAVILRADRLVEQRRGRAAAEKAREQS